MKKQINVGNDTLIVPKNNGITLIALVITIIILIILASISINAVFGQNGLITKTLDAKEEMRGASVQEARDLFYLEKEMVNESLTEGELTALVDKLVTQGLLTPDERLFIVDQGNWYVEIGSRSEDKAIIFKESSLPSLIKDLFDDETGPIKTGHYVDYNPWLGATDSYTVQGQYSTQNGGGDQIHNRIENLNWRVLDKKGDSIRLISETPIAISGGTGLTLQGENGYNNAVKLIDELCAIYGGDKGTAQGLKIEDIQDHMTEKNLKNITVEYGDLYAPSRYVHPVIFAEENDQLGNGSTGHLGLSEQYGGANNGWYTGFHSSTPFYSTYTYWNKSMSLGDFEKPIYYELFLNNGANYSPYWLSSRCSISRSSATEYLVRQLGDGKVSATNLFTSNVMRYSKAYEVRSVITLESGAKLDESDSTRNGTSALPWKIK